jgi:hypothetical protein
MKQKRKTILKLLIFGIFFMLFGCSEDLYEAENKNQYGFKVSHKKFQDLLQQPKFKKAITKVEKEREKENLSTNKTIMEVQYGFTIVENIVNVLENDTITSYTLLVTRENTPENVVENLIIQVKSQNEITAFLLKYTNESDFYDGFNMKDFQGTKTLIPIIYNTNQVNTTGKMVYVEVCSTLTSWYCYGPGQHSDSDGCTMGFPISQEVCSLYGYDDGIGSGGSSGGGGGSGGNYSSNTPSDPTILTSPTSPIKNFNLSKTPCETLKKDLSTTTGIKLKSPQIYNFLTSNLNQPKEYGFYFKKENNIYTPYPSYNATTDKITIQIGGTSFCSIHTHPYPSANPMFSWEDMYSLQQFFMLANQELLEEVTIYLVCTDNYSVNQLYAIKIDDFDGFTDFLNNDITSTVTPQDLAGLTTEEDRSKEILRLMNAKQHKYNLKNPNMNQEIPFLNYFAGSGASLYKANSTLTNWDKLTLSNNTTNPITKTPCN